MPKHHVEKFLTEEEVDKKISEIGRIISKDYEGKKIHLVCVLRGGAFFMCERKYKDRQRPGRYTRRQGCNNS